MSRLLIIIIPIFLLSLFLAKNIFSPRLSTFAVTKVNNWDFNGNATGWSSTNGTGTTQCGDTTSGTETNFPTFAYNGAIGGQTGWQGVTNTTGGANFRGQIYQTIVAPGSGTVYAKGQFSVYANSSKTFQTSWIRVDLYNSTNTAYIANIGCTTFTASNTWTTIPISSDIGLTGGTTYTVRATLRVKNRASSPAAVTVAVDNININFAPVGLSSTNTVDTTDVSLSWTASTGGTGAPALHGTNPYKVYRDSTTPVTTFLSNATSPSFLDTGCSGNTTYYYSVSDVDTNSFESPFSAVSSLKTRPGAPGTPTFTNIGVTSLTVNWTEPGGGADSYKIERCSGSSCSNFSQIASNIVGTTYPDSSLSASTLYRYRLRGVNSTGDGVYSGIGETSTTALISISLVTDGSLPLGFIGLGSSRNTTPVDLNHPEIIQIDSGPANLTAQSTNFTEGGNTWFLNTGNGITRVQWEFSKDASSWTTFAVAANPYSFDTNVTVGATRPIYFRLTMPSSTDSYNQYGSTTTITASSP